MSSEKKPPNLPARIEADVTRDLRAVGGFFSGLFRFTQRAERVVQEAAREDDERERMNSPRPIARVGKTEVLPKCEVCGDKKTLGEGKKIPCPVCTKVR